MQLVLLETRQSTTAKLLASKLFMMSPEELDETREDIRVLERKTPDVSMIVEVLE